MRRAATGLLLIACACTHAPSTTSPPASSTSRARNTLPPRATGLAACPAPEAFSRLPTFARDLGSPDDLLTLPDGTVWVSDPAHGTLRHLRGDGRVLQTIDDPDAPEGIALLPDGRLAVAEQRRNRVVAFRPPATARTVLFELPSAGAALGVDGIAYDTARARLLVPDSPHETLVAWPLGGRPVVIARGLGRAVGVAVGPGGAIYVVAEAVPGLMRITSGRGEPVGRIIQADDVVAANGLLYVTLIGTGELVAVDPATGAQRVLATGIEAAQGLALLSDGRLAIADSNRGRIAIAGACG